MCEKRYTVWISNADCLADVLEIDQDLLHFDDLLWDDAMKLFKLSLEQGYTCIMIRGEGGGQ